MSPSDFKLRIQVRKSVGKPRTFPEDADVIIYWCDGRTVVRISDSFGFNEFETIFERLAERLHGYTLGYGVYRTDRRIEIYHKNPPEAEAFFFG